MEDGPSNIGPWRAATLFLPHPVPQIMAVAAPPGSGSAGQVAQSCAPLPSQHRILIPASPCIAMGQRCGTNRCIWIFTGNVVDIPGTGSAADHKGYNKCFTNTVTYSVIRSIERGEPVFDVCRIPCVHIPSCHHKKEV